MFDVALEKALIVIDGKRLATRVTPSAGEVVASGESATRAANNKDLDIGILFDLGKRFSELGDESGSHRIEFFRTIQGKRSDAVAFLQNDIRECHGASG